MTDSRIAIRHISRSWRVAGTILLTHLHWTMFTGCHSSAEATVTTRVILLVPENEVASMASFGHAVADYAVRLGELAGARRVLLAHHKHDRTDDALDFLAARFRTGPAEVMVAAEGTIFDL